MSYTPQTTFVNGVSPWPAAKVRPAAKVQPVAKVRPQYEPAAKAEPQYELVGAYVKKSKLKTPVQDAVFVWLAANPHSTLEDISRAFGTNTANANSTIWRMMQYHLVVRAKKAGAQRMQYMYKVVQAS